MNCHKLLLSKHSSSSIDTATSQTDWLGLSTWRPIRNSRRIVRWTARNRTGKRIGCFRLLPRFRIRMPGPVRIIFWISLYIRCKISSGPPVESPLKNGDLSRMNHALKCQEKCVHQFQANTDTMLKCILKEQLDETTKMSTTAWTSEAPFKITTTTL